jgi:hypothetical protein
MRSLASHTSTCQNGRSNGSSRRRRNRRGSRVVVRKEESSLSVVNYIWISQDGGVKSRTLTNEAHAQYIPYASFTQFLCTGSEVLWNEVQMNLENFLSSL